MLVVTLGDLLLDVVVRLEAPPAPDDDVPAAIALVPRWPGCERRRLGLLARRAGAPRRAPRRRRGGPGRRGGDGETRVELAGPVVAGERSGTVVALAAPDGSRTLASDRRAAGELGRTTSTRACSPAPRAARRGLHAHARGGAEAALRLAGRPGATVLAWQSTSPRRTGSRSWDARDAEARGALAPDVVFANEAEAAAFGEPLGDVWVVKRGARGCAVNGGVVAHADRDRGRRRHDGRRGRIRRGLPPRARPLACSAPRRLRPAASTRVGALP